MDVSKEVGLLLDCLGVCKIGSQLVYCWIVGVCK